MRLRRVDASNHNPPADNSRLPVMDTSPACRGSRATETTGITARTGQGTAVGRPTSLGDPAPALPAGTIRPDTDDIAPVQSPSRPLLRPPLPRRPLPGGDRAEALKTVEVGFVEPRHLAGGGGPAWITVPLHRACGWS